jgi:hypothetical protein
VDSSSESSDDDDDDDDDDDENNNKKSKKKKSRPAAVTKSGVHLKKSGASKQSLSGVASSTNVPKSPTERFLIELRDADEEGVIAALLAMCEVLADLLHRYVCVCVRACMRREKVSIYSASYSSYKFILLVFYSWNVSKFSNYKRFF